MERDLEYENNNKGSNDQFRNKYYNNKEWGEFFDTVCNNCHDYLLKNSEG